MSNPVCPLRLNGSSAAFVINQDLRSEGEVNAGPKCYSIRSNGTLDNITHLDRNGRRVDCQSIPDRRDILPGLPVGLGSRVRSSPPMPTPQELAEAVILIEKLNHLLQEMQGACSERQVAIRTELELFLPEMSLLHLRLWANSN